MTGGIEVAGLALSVFPIVIETVDWYKGVITGRDIRLLDEALKNNHQIFRNSIDYLLRSTIPAEQLEELLGDLKGERWKDVVLSEHVIKYIGRDAQELLELIRDIHRILSKLHKELELIKIRKPQPTPVDRAKKIVKYFVRGSHLKASLDRLKVRINEFRLLTEDALKLAPSGDGIPRLNTLQEAEMVQECASALHDALWASWKCDCDQLHPANIKLDIWCSRSSNSGNVYLEFSFLFADDAQCAHHDDWMVFATAPSVNASSAPPSLVLSPVNTHTSNNPAATTDSAQGASQGAGDIVEDLCPVRRRTGAPSAPLRRRLGSMSDPAGNSSFDLYSRTDSTNTKTSLKLADFLHQRNSRKERVQLGLMLAWGVLQISPTNWLNGMWSKDNILLVNDATDMLRPYISHRFTSTRRNSQTSTLAPANSNVMADWVQHQSLFALGIFLLEMCYGKTIEDLATNEEKSPETGKPLPHTPILTAMRLSRVVHEEAGQHAAQAIRSCLSILEIDMDQEGRPKNYPRFAESVMKKVVNPLKAYADTFE